MSPTLLVALREFRQIAATRSFWITLLLLPLTILITQFTTRMLRPEPGVAFVIVDDTGRYAPAIQARIELDHQRQILTELSTYARRWEVAPTGGHRVWGSGPRWFSEAEVAAFRTAGGLAGAERELGRLKPEAAPDFKPPPPRFIAAAPLGDVQTGRGPDAFGRSLEPHLGKDVATPLGPRPLALGVYIPAEHGAAGAPARFWTSGRPNTALAETVRGELDRQAQAQALGAAGIDPAQLAQISAVRAPVGLTVPEGRSGRERLLLQSALPLTFAYLLLMALMLSGSWALQGLVEERSNKLLEAVLACVSPNQLLYGKLIGVVGVGLTMIAVWIAFALGVAFAVQGAVADFLRPALASVSSPSTVAALIYFFIAGYLSISMLFLAVGAVSDSMRDAQGYLTPIILGLTLPFVTMMGAVLQDPDGLLPRVLSWIPLWTPFAMMARLGSGVAVWEVLGTALLLAGFIVLEFMLLGRIFRASLLQAGQKLSFKSLGGMLRPQEG